MSETNLRQRRLLRVISSRTDMVDEFEPGPARDHAITLAAVDGLRLLQTLEPVDGDRHE